MEDYLPCGSHFHVDKTCGRLWLSETTLVQDIKDSLEVGYRPKVLGGVAVFCDLNKYPTKVEISHTNRECFQGDVGAYLKGPLSSEDNHFILMLTKQPGIKVSSEVGIDLAVTFPDFQLKWEREPQVSQPYQVMRLRLPVLCDPVPPGQFAYLYTLRSRTELILPSSKIQWHCISGICLTVHSLQRRFINTHCSMYGRTNPYRHNGTHCRTLWAIAWVQLVREMDLTYSKVTRGHPYSNPYLLGYAAQQIAKILRDLDMEVVLGLTDENPSRLSD
ncbi:uncharacterized protein [Argopecten irradians]|uniref:uncharacterized protein n=1 Tax=Argopecten irradians TaxID=31199 RepID=UPI0037132983